ncbi:transposase, partial [Aerococcaceae bacterium DSM 111176]|nr:transposase [Aerococcaceae bacterium DSM 111176]
MTYLHFNEILLGIKDPNITLTGALQKESYRTVKQFRPSSKDNLSEKQANKAVLSLEGHLDKLPKACVHCGVKNNGSQDIIRNGSMKTAILIGQYNYQAVYLKLKKQRYLCKHCLKTTVAESKLINRHCFISNPVKFLIVKELSEIQSMTLIAKHMNVSIHTVIRQLKSWGDNLNPRPTALPSHLSIDEFKSVKAVKNAMSAIIMDNSTHKVVDILEDRTQEYLRTYFLRFPMNERLKVKTITMDMYSPYREFLPRLFPNAIVIIDRFHIVQLLNR